MDEGSKLFAKNCLFSRIKCRYMSAVGETASNLGTAMDELMRHQPTLKTDAMTAIIKVFYHTLESHLSLGILCLPNTFKNVQFVKFHERIVILYQGSHRSWKKSWNLLFQFPGLESHGI